VAENTVVKEQLTESMIHSGAELTAKLDKIGVTVVAALWFFVPEINEWRLFFASPEVITQGRDPFTRKFVEQLRNSGSDIAIPLSMIGVLEAEADLVRLLRAAAGTGPEDISRIRFSKNVIDGHFIDDALIYRAA